MKLLRFRVDKHTVLQDVVIDFGPLDTKSHLTERPQAYAIDFLVGVNGTGKSTVLRLLGSIFRALESSRLQDIHTGFELRYVLRPVSDEPPKEVQIHHFQETNGAWTTTIQLDGQPVDSLDGRVLPARVVVLTSGDEGAWLNLATGDDPVATTNDEALKLPVIQRYMEELPGHLPKPSKESRPVQPSQLLLFMQSQHLPLVTLCGISSHYTHIAHSIARGLPIEDAQRSAPLSLILEECRIKVVVGFSLRCRAFEQLTDERQKGLVSRLREHASSCGRVVQQGADQQLVFLCPDGMHSLAAKFAKDTELGSGLALLEHLYPLVRPDEFGNQVLQDLDIFFQPYHELADNALSGGNDQMEAQAASSIPPLHLLKWLSDGERTFLGRMSLLSLLDKPDTLALLDEPEVHFNDYWKRRIVKLLSSVMKDREVHAVITTHSSIALTDVPKKDVVVLKRPGLYTKEAVPPPVETFAADPSDLIVHVFGAPFATGQFSVDEIIALLREADLSEGARTRQERMHQLQQIIDENRVAPGYFRFRIREKLYRLSTGP